MERLAQFAALVEPHPGIRDHHQGENDHQIDISTSHQELIREGTDPPCRPELQSQQKYHPDSKMSHEVVQMHHCHGMEAGCFRHGPIPIPGSMIWIIRFVWHDELRIHGMLHKPRVAEYPLCNVGIVEFRQDVVDEQWPCQTV
jgi:hypothetical protein